MTDPARSEQARPDRPRPEAWASAPIRVLVAEIGRASCRERV